LSAFLANTGSTTSSIAVFCPNCGTRTACVSIIGTGRRWARTHQWATLGPAAALPKSFRLSCPDSVFPPSAFKRTVAATNDVSRRFPLPINPSIHQSINPAFNTARPR